MTNKTICNKVQDATICLVHLGVVFLKQYKHLSTGRSLCLLELLENLKLVQTNEQTKEKKKRKQRRT